MTTENLLKEIEATLANFRQDDLVEAGHRLLETLGYRSDRTLDLPGPVSEFLGAFPAPNQGTQTEMNFRARATSARVLFQFTDSEIAAAQPSHLDSGDFDTGNSSSFVFIAVELQDASYPRSAYVELTREINKRLSVPAVVLFRTADSRFSLAFVHRRPHKLDPNRDVLGSVSLIREIDTSNPHRAHLDILKKLALPERLSWMDIHRKPHNFDGLLFAWLDALDTEELNRNFYRQLFTWFERAVKEAKFPDNQVKTLPPQVHVIRLITRLLFVWFIKEKGLIAPELFTENQIGPLLRDYDSENGDSYYRAVLQNLFFATLNSEIGQRSFSKECSTTYRIFSRYRYRAEIADPKGLLKLFSKTPFINGGLFDCLDSEEGSQQGGYRIDCFTDNVNVPKREDYNILSIPNSLFFDNKGLISLFDRFQFTVEENTPTEKEVALDPELLGKVFENLLAAYNPETSKNARRQTGSYYTPREVVDYMVDEVLVASLAQKCAPTDGKTGRWRDRLLDLLDYEVDYDHDTRVRFDDTEKKQLVRAIAGLKLIDPAVGSGAFPMGALHKLTLALRRLDPQNTLWKGLQTDLAKRRASGAFDTDDKTVRNEVLKEVSDTFEKYRDSDFGRKLYLIQNSIYGVDIQPIACQIARLRFFISLAIEQEPSGEAEDNYGIKPLPNLETRFVAADTLLALDTSGTQMSLTPPEVTQLQEDLNTNRERHFHATTRKRKQECRDRDKVLRIKLADALQHVVGLPAAAAASIASWNPYDQSVHAGWFDAWYMFGVDKGFDIVIGNPPYYQVQKGTYSAAHFPYSEGRDKGKQNLYKLFVEQSFNLCRNEGVATLIVQSSLMCDLSSAATRQLLLDRTQLRYIIEFPERARSRDAQVFTSVTQGTCIYQFCKELPNGNSIRISVGNDAQTISDLSFVPIAVDTIKTLWPNLYCFPFIREGSIAILEKIAANKTIRPLEYYAEIIIQGDLNLTTHSARFSNIISSIRLLRGRHVARFVVKYDAVTEFCEQGFLAHKVDDNKRKTFLISQEVMNQQAHRRLNFALTTPSTREFLWGHSVNKTLLKNPALSNAFLALLNSKFMDWFFRVTSTNTHVQGYELKQLPIPALTSSDRNRLDTLATRILSAKEIDPSADTSALEVRIDQLVYKLYGLTDEEIAVVEGHS